MQKYISLFFSVLLFLTACQSEDRPKGVLNEKDMISLLLDIHLTDGSVYQVPQVPDSLYKYSSQKYVALFKRHHTTDAVYKTSLKYYSTQPEKIQDIYSKIEAIIKAKVDSLNKVTAAEAAKAKPAPAGPTPVPTPKSSNPNPSSKPVLKEIK
ncbi:MAG: DUF4296 domain-containing protein [Mucilaginibacter sp.]|jgi:hypothetical protein|uniref:DUF4296 domain-containing protein n=1 Tax=Mucilaginibacter sp. TaxID=1882438 RepID=UPI00356605A5